MTHLQVSLSNDNFGTAFFARSKYSEFTSIPIDSSPHAFAAASVDPDPMNGSSMIPLPKGKEA